jgi:hypothetical protein
MDMQRYGDFLDTAYPETPKVVRDMALKLYTKNAPTAYPDRYEFTLKGYPVGVSVRGEKCTCMEDAELGIIDVCAHRLAVALHQMEHGLQGEQDMSEATQHGDAQNPHSMTFTAVDGDGFEWLICLREPTVDALFDAARKAKERVQRYGWIPKSGHRKIDAQSPQGTVSISTDTHATTSVHQFDCDKLTVTFDPEREKNYYKIKGSKIFKDYGVGVWPEVLEAAGFTNLTPKVYDLSGWRAEYSVKEDGKKPDKVTKLVRS